MGYEGRDLPHSQAPALQVLGGVNIIYDAKMAKSQPIAKCRLQWQRLKAFLKFSHIYSST